MPIDPFSIAALIAMATSSIVQYQQGNKQLKQQKREFAANQEAAAEARQEANEEAMAQKRALIAEQESMAEGTDASKKKKKSLYQQQAAAYQASGSGWGLGTTDDGKLG